MVWVVKVFFFKVVLEYVRLRKKDFDNSVELEEDGIVLFYL